ncbi:MAG: hypothetical protein M3N19_03135 [Candidatus Eremiobacteraeota bacterium]|nr:hypothetical protein [Candidatus Eremiobacteraeota bacterium]
MRFNPQHICFTFDVEWACREAIEDTCRLLDERGIAGTFFVTHDGVSVPGHERGLHPNFRRDGDIYQTLPSAAHRSETEVMREILVATKRFAPEARGVRAHSLFFDSTLLPIYAAHGIEYDSTYRLELQPGIQPFLKQDNVLEIPAYYADYYDLVTGTTGFQVAGLKMDQPGLKVVDFHPNLIYTNVSTAQEYAAIKLFYHDPERLLAARHGGRGIRTLFVELLDFVAGQMTPTATLGEVNKAWRDQ